MPDPGTIAAVIHEALRGRQPWLVALVGVPGAGKSTVAAALAERIPGAVVVPMDGYHLPRRALSPDQLGRRGAPDTFNPEALRTDLARLKEARTGVFPAFDHAAKDPRPEAVVVPPGTSLVIVEGLYLMLSEWRLQDLFDFSVFLDCDPGTASTRVAERHLAAGLAATPDEARSRADTNDRRNASIVLDDGCRERADLVVSGC